jgi:6-phosphogluconolactonase
VQPGLPGQVCSVTNGTGTMGLSDVTLVAVDCQLPAPKFAYVLTQADNLLTPYSVNPTTGALSTVTTAPSVAVGTATTPFAAVIDPRGRTLWASSNGGIAGSTGSVTVFAINATTGALTQRAAVPIGARPESLAFDPTGRFVYVAGFSGDGITAISVNAAGLPSSFIGTIAAGTNPTSIKLDPTGKFLYVTNATDDTVSRFTVSSTTGSLTFVSSAAATGDQPSAFAVDPLARFAYVTNGAGNDASAYAVDSTTGALTEIDQNGGAAGTRIPTQSGPSDIAIDPLGRFAFVTNDGSNSVSYFMIDQTTGALGTGSFVLTGGQVPTDLTVDPSGKFLYVNNAGPGPGVAGSISVFSINQSTGALSAVGGTLLHGANGGSIAILPVQ